MVLSYYLCNETKNMIKLYKYITEGFDDMLKMTPEDKETLLKLDVMFNDLANEYEKEHTHFANITNMDEQIDGIINAVNGGDHEYELDIQYEESKFSDDKWCNRFIKKLNDLKCQFIDLRCYVTKFYIYRINKIIEQIMFLNEFTRNPDIKSKVKNRPSKKLYKYALQLIKENPFVDIKDLIAKDKDYDRTVGPEESQKRLQKIIDDLGYGWKVVIDDNMVPRMSVRPYQEFRINGKNKFSEVDLQSLEVHEINVHTARKYYALQSGLYLFLHGLKGNNVYDEGLAIYNSLHKVKKPKPNILFFICLKIIILYHIQFKSIVDVFNLVKKITGVEDRMIALAIIRSSRVYTYTILGNYSYDEDYLDGYERVKDMTDEERERLLHFPIGPDQLYEIDTLEKFLKINKFKPLKIKKPADD